MSNSDIADLPPLLAEIESLGWDWSLTKNTDEQTGAGYYVCDCDWHGLNYQDEPLVKIALGVGETMAKSAYRALCKIHGNETSSAILPLRDALKSPVTRVLSPK